MRELPRAEQEFLARAERRLGRVILLLLPVGAAAAAWQWGGRMALAFALGGVLTYLNYRWIVAVVDAMVKAQKKRVPRGAYLKLFLPLLLLALLLYAIFTRAWLSPVGVLSGLLLLVAAVILEAVYEVFLVARE